MAFHFSRNALWSTKNEIPSLEFELGEKVDFEMSKKPRVFLTFRFFLCLKPCCQRWSCFSNLAASDVETVKFLSLWRFGRLIRVTQENWAFFFHEKYNSALSHIGQTNQKIIKNSNQFETTEISVCSSFFATGDPLLPIGQTVGRLWGRLWGSLWGGFGRLWGALGDVEGVFGESLGGFGEALGVFQSLSSPRAFSSSPIYKKTNQTPDQPL